MSSHSQPAPAPGKRGMVPEPKWFLWVALGLMVLGIVELVRLRGRGRTPAATPEPAPEPVAAPVPLPRPLRLRVRTGTSETTTNGDAPTGGGKVRIAVKQMAEPRAEPADAAPALGEGARVVVRARVAGEQASAPEAEGAAAVAGDAVRVRVRGGTETIEIDGNEPAILARR